MKQPHPTLFRVLLASALLFTSAAWAAPITEATSPASPEMAGPPSDPPAPPAGVAVPEAAASLTPTLSVAPVASSADGDVGLSDVEIPDVEIQYSELPNFHRVDAKLYRGGQPKAGGIARLKSLGIGTVLDLRYEPWKIKAEREAAKAAGLRYYALPMYGLVRPSQAEIARALSIIEDPVNGPVFVHCERGSDRTGLVAACYRIKSMNWTAKQAIDEAMGYGMYRIEGAKRSFIRDFYARTVE